MRISPATLTEIKAHIRIEEVIGDYVTFKRKGSGQNLWACCPFPTHNEETPSFAVHPQKGFYKCFGCDEKGDAITFLQKIKSFSYLEAMEHLAKKYQIAWIVEDHDNHAKGNQQKKQGLYLLLAQAEEYYQSILAQHSTAQNYLAQREIPKATITQFKIGCSPDAWQAWNNLAIQKGYSKEMLLEAGLIIEKNNKTYDRFRNRILFPIHDTIGRPVGFGARQIKKDPNSPKYINSPETAIYQKSQLLYGLYQAKETIKKEGYAYLVEGYTDVLALSTIGIKQVIATAGTSLTQEQVTLFKRFSPQVILLLDGDEAGRKATSRNIDLFLAQGIDVKITLLPIGEDPASHIKKIGAQPFKDYLNSNTTDFITFKIRNIPKENPLEKTKVIHNIIHSISLIPDKIKQAIYLDICSKITQMDKALLQEALQTAHTTQFSIAKLSRKKQTASQIPATHTEATILTLLLRHGNEKLNPTTNMATYLFQELEEITFTHPTYKELYHLLHKTWTTHKKIDPTQLIEGQPEPIKAKIIDLIAKKFTMSKTWEQKKGSLSKSKKKLTHLTHRAILHLKLKNIKQHQKEARKNLIHLTDPQKIDEKLTFRKVLREIEQEISKKLGISVYPTRPLGL